MASGRYRLGMDLTANSKNLGGGGPVAAVPNNAGTKNPVRVGNAMHPSVAFLMILILFEYAVLGVLRYVFRHAHGG